MGNSANGIILSIGSVNADFQVRVDQEAGKTTTMLAHDFVRLSGGKAANVAFLARRLGVPATLVARVGKDDLQEQALKPLQEAGVDISYVRKVEGASTGVSMIAVPPNGKKFIILAANANDLWEKEDEESVRRAIGEAPKGSVLVIIMKSHPLSLIWPFVWLPKEDSRLFLILHPQTGLSWICSAK